MSLLTTMQNNTISYLSNNGYNHLFILNNDNTFRFSKSMQLLYTIDYILSNNNILNTNS